MKPEVVEAIREWIADVQNTTTPNKALFIAGPPASGKTVLACAVAEVLERQVAVFVGWPAATHSSGTVEGCVILFDNLRGDVTHLVWPKDWIVIATSLANFISPPDKDRYVFVVLDEIPAEKQGLPECVIPMLRQVLTHPASQPDSMM